MRCDNLLRLSTILVYFVFVLSIFYTEVIGQINICSEKREEVRRTVCNECSHNSLRQCPSGYTQDSSGIGVHDANTCRLTLSFTDGRIVRIGGCYHLCRRNISVEQCCSGYWGKDCQACPGSPVCSSGGNCFDKKSGNGTCSCQDGFKGSACEFCTSPTRFGAGCNQNCSCEHGECDSGVQGSGLCKPYSCQIGYIGQNCNQRLPACDHALCGNHSDCFKINGTDICVCEPGYTGDGQHCTAINPCASNGHGCHKNAACHFKGPGKHSCTCVEGYTGDGTVCTVIDPCQTSNGGCPSNSSVCNFLGPNKGNCSCLPGFENFQDGAGCSMVDLCKGGGGCDINANCIMPSPGQKMCICKDGFRGNFNNTHCYGSIIQRLEDLNDAGPAEVRSKLTIARRLVAALAWPLAGSGPFTALVPTDQGFLKSLSQAKIDETLSSPDLSGYLARLHIIASDLDSVKLKALGTVTTLQGTNATITEKNGTLYFSGSGQDAMARIIMTDLIAGNGLIHILDTAMKYPANFSSSSDMSVLDVIQSSNELSTLSSLLQLSGVGSTLVGLSLPVTIFAPVNAAFSSVDNVTIRYLTTTQQGKQKLSMLLKNHIFDTKINVEDLITMNRITSSTEESSLVSLKQQGLLVLGRNSRLISANLGARDGVLHMVDHVIVPDSLMPLVPRYCNIITNQTSRGRCYHCQLIDKFPNRGCESDTIPSGLKQACTYYVRYSYQIFRFSGCTMSSCRKKIETPECCAGFYSPACHPCPGPLDNPCYGNGKCSDKISGSGVCTCEPAFKGTACELCANSNQYGKHCNQTCTCVHGICMGGIHGNGTCKPGTCLAGYHGNNCDLRDMPCSGSTPLSCHIHAHCVRENGLDQCKCNSGYEGSGQQCYEIDPCAKSDRGGCHKDAICKRTGPNMNNCSCANGFRGDGIECVPIDPCLESDKGSCHDNAICKYTGPGQSICACNAGYTGDGRACVEINNCLVNNGDCASKAYCTRTGPATHNCTCNWGYAGDGYTCLASVATVVEENANLKELSKFVSKTNLRYYLASAPLMTLFAPSSAAIASIASDDLAYWSASSDRMEYLIKYHIGNSSYSVAMLRNISVVPVLNGRILNLTYTNFQIVLNDVAVIQSNISTINGMVYIINKVLIPPRLLSPVLPTVNELLQNTPSLSDLYNISKIFNLLPTLEACDGCTIFAPSNQALRRFYLKNNLTPTILKYHVVPQYISIKSVYNGQQFSTYLGRDYLIRVTLNDFKVNGFQVNATMLPARKAVIYVLDGVLVPTKSQCNEYNTITRYTSCTLCWLADCPSSYRTVSVKSCSVFFFCYATCQKTIMTPKCCKGFWGNDCQACPGNVTAPCLGNGQCSDGLRGNGHCNCSANFTGTECEKCIPSKYGKDCSSRCRCVNGRCSAGRTGDGSCTCNHGWKGQYCNQSANYAQCLPARCHTHSTCRDENGVPRCVCDDGYTGNGTYCRVIHPCEKNNGGCHDNAICSRNLVKPFLAVCTCNQGYSGDGQYCYEIDLCQVDNGGCHANALCLKTGPGKRSCHCKAGYTGDGLTSCTAFNPCVFDNGGCSLRARCEETGPGQRKCTCAAPYVGDGVTCNGDSIEVLLTDPELSKAADLLKANGLDDLFKTSTSLTFAAPTNKAFDKLTPQTRKRRSVSSQASVDQYLRYHMVSCVRMTNETLQRGGEFTSLLGPPIWLINNGSQLYFMDSWNNTALVTQVYASSNGYVFKLKTLLEPPLLQTNYPQLSLPDAAQKLGYSQSVDLLKMSGLGSLFSSPYGRPFLVFLATNGALNKLPSEMRTRLTSPSHIDELRKYNKYHVVENAPSNISTDFLVRGGGGVELRTMEGETLFLSCRGGKGDIYVNGLSKIVQRDIRFDGGVAFGIDSILLPLGLGGSCDEVTHQTFNGSCGNCFTSLRCPSDASRVGTATQHCQHEGDALGCMPLCLRRLRVKKCCSNFYGPDCRACPGDIRLPCSGRGQCDDGLTGTGSCTCDAPYVGTSCERCNDNTTCPVFPSCNVNSGGCHAFATCLEQSGRVNCTCNNGYEGDGFYCQMIDRCSHDNGGCGPNATCHFQGPGQRVCQCKQGFHMVRDSCVGHAPGSQCAVNHGGCSINAGCSDTTGHVVCTCLVGYTGDGITCEGNVLQVLQSSIKLKEFYKAVYFLMNSGNGNILFSELQSTQRNFTVFAPIRSAVGSKKFTLELLKHHVVLGSVTLLHMANGTTLTTLLGSKLVIRKLEHGVVTVNGVAHVLGDIIASNGIIHVLDQVLPIVGPVPPQPTTVAPPMTSGPTTTTPISTSAAPEITTANPGSPSTTTKSVTTPQTSPKTPQTPATLPTTQTPEPGTEKTMPTTATPGTGQPTTPLTTSVPSDRSTEQQTSSPPSTTAKAAVYGKQKSQGEGLSGGSIGGIIFAVIFLLVIMAAVIWYYRKKSLPPASFRYFKVGVSEFDNPLYMLDETDIQRIAPDESPAIEPPGVENPLYAEISSGVPKDEEKPDKPHDYENPLYAEAAKADLKEEEEIPAEKLELHEQSAKQGDEKLTLPPTGGPATTPLDLEIDSRLV
ncbi:stabilin-2 isoform X2 [Nematostella vectensis]|uniref:stabilin-2 isoform X2 n=1 Tax=Nematostella vectensis TaxID=45351 RepID=UPI00207789EA|nr:stabilin-2 isoform X2 [Nematostella vectensis]